MFVPNCSVPKGFPEVCGSRPRQVLTDCRLGNQYAYFSVEGSEAQGERRRVLSHSPGSCRARTRAPTPPRLFPLLLEDPCPRGPDEDATCPLEREGLLFPNIPEF